MSECGSGSRRAAGGLARLLRRGVACACLLVLLTPSLTAAAGHGSRGSSPDSVSLASGVLRELVAAAAQGQPAIPGVTVIGGRVRVEIIPARGRDVAPTVAAVGGQMEGKVGNVLAQALVPIDRLVELEATPAVPFL